MLNIILCLDCVPNPSRRLTVFSLTVPSCSQAVVLLGFCSNHQQEEVQLLNYMSLVRGSDGGGGDGCDHDDHDDHDDDEGVS